MPYPSLVCGKDLSTLLSCTQELEVHIQQQKKGLAKICQMHPHRNTCQKLSNGDFSNYLVALHSILSHGSGAHTFR